MPWPVIYSQRGSCVYQCCEPDGHSVCVRFGEYYEKLCRVAQAAADAPTPENLDALKVVLAESEALHYD